MPKSIFRKFSKNLVIISNVVVALLFLLCSYNCYFFPIRWWFVGLLNLLSFYFLLILLVYFLFWIIVKPIRSLISVITILLAIKSINQIIPFRVSSKFNIQKEDNSLRVMSWNVAQFDIRDYKKDSIVKRKMLDLINSYNPDIACFQEMVCADTIVDLNTPYYQKYSFYSLDSFLKDLNFPYYFYAYNPKEDFYRSQHFGIIIFSKYPIINKQMISEYPHNYNSIFQYVDVLKNEDTFRVFNIHLQSLRFTPSNLKYIDNPSMNGEKDLQKSMNLIDKLKNGFIKRQAQADRIKGQVEQSPYPTIVCGDFNDVPNSYSYCVIGKKMKNAFVEKGSGIGCTFSEISPTLRIDNIFVDKKLAVQQFTTIQKKLSDHYPIIADIKKGF